jgi:hypothetical protein
MLRQDPSNKFGGTSMVDGFSPFTVPGDWSNSCDNLVPKTRAMG